MGKNILVMTGSPRKGGNSDILADSFIKGAEDAGHRITRFDAGRKHITACKACNRCYSGGSPCVEQDDFHELAPMIEEADAMVIVTPLYWYTYPTQVKAAIDKLYALLVGQRPVKVKETALIVCGDSVGTEVFAGIQKTHQEINKLLHWEDKGVLIVPEVEEAGAVRKTDFPRKAEEMGRNYK